MWDGDWTAQRSLGRRLEALLAVRGCSSTELAARLDVPEQLVEAWLEDVCTPTVLELRLLGLVLRVSLEAVVFGRDGRRCWLS